MAYYSTGREGGVPGVEYQWYSAKGFSEESSIGYSCENLLAVKQGGSHKCRDVAIRT